MTIEQLKQNRTSCVVDLVAAAGIAERPNATSEDRLVCAVHTGNVLLSELLVMLKEREGDVVGIRQTLEDISGGLAAVLPDLTVQI